MKNIITVLAVVMLCYFVFIKEKRPDSAEYLTDSNDTIIMYSTNNCRYCKLAKQQLKAAKARFVEYDIERDKHALARFKKLGGRGVPLFELNGKVTRGYNSEAIKKLIADVR